MPYTPPARSPSASPSSSRSSSFSSNNDARTRSTLNLLESSNPPRSATYLHKHRRSSAGTLPPFPAPVTEQNSTASLSKRTPAESTSAVMDPRSSSSIHRSPPPVDSGLSPMPTGAYISPPDSTQNSSDEEDGNTRRNLGRLEEELKEAIKKLPQARFPSPERKPVQAESMRGRVHSHQRARSDTSMLIDIAVRTRSGSHSGSVSDMEDDAYREAPAMVRKKSGEVVKSSLKSPSRSRPCSVPSTPTFPKNVHFDARIEHVRHFLHSEKPSAVSVGSSPVEGVYDGESEYPFGYDDETPQWEIGLPNFPKDVEHRKALPVRLEKICLSTDKKNLIGTVVVANVAFQKHVVARFTFDYWQTVSEVSAEYSSDVRRKEREDGVDRFVFKIKLTEQANLEKKTLFFCVRYSSGGQEYWDNNGGVNFQVDFKKASRTSTQGPSLSSLPRSKPNSLSSRPRSMPTMELELFEDGFFGIKDVRSSDRPKSKSKSLSVEDSPMPARRANPTGNAFGNRYDFRSSFKATVKVPTVPTPLPRIPALDVTDATPKMEPRSSYFNLPVKPAHLAGHISPTTPLDSPSLSGAGHPDIFSTDNFWTHEGKPSIESPSYRELIDNYCFFGSSKATKASPPYTEVKESPEQKIKHSLQQILLPTAANQPPSPHYVTGPSNGNTVTPPSLSLAQQKSSGNASPIPLNYAGYHHRRRGSGAFRFDAAQTTTAIC